MKISSHNDFALLMDINILLKISKPIKSSLAAYGSSSSDESDQEAAAPMIKENDIKEEKPADDEKIKTEPKQSEADTPEFKTPQTEVKEEKTAKTEPKSEPSDDAQSGQKRKAEFGSNDFWSIMTKKKAT